MNTNLPVNTMTESGLSRPAVSSRLQLVLNLLLLCAIAGTCLFLYTRHNRFPYSWHPDEIAKARQVVERQNLFFHPLLMLTGTRVAVAIVGGDLSHQEVVQIGRKVSAVYAALAVIAFAAAACLLRGWLAAHCAALFIGLSPFLLVNAHYMKEDTSLLLGFGMVFCAMACQGRISQGKWAGFLGAACALAASGKYIGGLSILLALPLLLRISLPERRSLLRCYWVAFALVFLLINAPAMGSALTFLRGVAYEIGHVTFAGHDSIRARFFSFENTDALLDQLSLPVMALAFAYYWILVRRPTQAHERLLAIFPPAFFILISLAQVHQPRYLLPISTTIQFFAALAVADLFRTRHMALKSGLAALIVIAVVLQGNASISALRQFKDDSRYALPQWIEQNLPQESLIVQESFSLLLDPGMARLNTLPDGPRLRAVYMMGDVGSLDRLREQGFTHVVVNDLMYSRFFNPNRYPGRGARERFEATRGIYRDIFTNGRLVWEKRPKVSLNAFTNPTVKVYDIRK